MLAFCTIIAQNCGQHCIQVHENQWWMRISHGKWRHCGCQHL